MQGYFGVSKSYHGSMPSLILSVREIGESRNYNTWSMYRAEEGHGRGGGEKKYFSLSDMPPLPLIGHPTALTILGFSIVVAQTKTITQEKMPGMQAT